MANDLRSTLEYIGLSGHALSVAEETALHCSLTILSQQTKKNVVFWGKVTGYNGDYLLCQCTGDDVLSARRTYYSTDGGLTWTMLNFVTPEQREFCEQIRGLFMGDPAFEYRIQKVLPPEDPVPMSTAPQPTDADGEAGEEEKEEDAEEEAEAEEAEDGEGAAQGDGAGAEGADGAGEGEGEEAKKPKKKKPRVQIIAIKESTRLSYFVEEHDYHCAVVPRGMYISTHDGRVVKNKTFEGLDPAAAAKLSNYFHLRKKEQQDGAAKSSIDFLDTIQDDIPRGVWCLKYDPLLDVVVGQNLSFLGSTFYLKPNAPVAGQFYIGDGEQNLDLCFML